MTNLLPASEEERQHIKGAVLGTGFYSPFILY